MSINTKDGKILGNNLTGVNQILPHVNKWAWDLYISSLGNNWVPSEIGMAIDIKQWKEKNFLSDNERLLVKRCLGFFAGSESLVSNNLLISVFKFITDPECRQYITLQAKEEAIHNHTIVYVCDSLGLEIKELYEAYINIPAIKAKDDFLINITKDINRQDFDPFTISGKQEILRNIITYYIICEGIFFYSGFAMLFSFGRQNKLPGISEQISLTIKDESNHIKFGINLILKIIEQNKDIWTQKFIDDTIEHIVKTCELEIAYAFDVLPNGLLGMNAEQFVSYIQYITNRRMESIGLKPIYKNVFNPFPWMAEVIDIIKQKNFFEKKVTDYNISGLKEDF